MSAQIRAICNIALFVAVCLAVGIALAPKAMGGPASYVIVDGSSMEPTYSHGDLVVAREAPNYSVGDVITYDAPVDGHFPVIHRVVESVEGGFITRGDNRDDDDGWIAPYDAIHGASWVHIPRGGVVIEFLRQPSAILAALAGWLMFGYLTRREQSTATPPVGDATQHSPGGVRTAEDAERITRTREQRKFVAFIAGGAVVGLAAAVFVAYASVLHVNAGTLQAFSFGADHLPEVTAQNESDVVDVRSAIGPADGEAQETMQADESSPDESSDHDGTDDSRNHEADSDEIEKDAEQQGEPGNEPDDVELESDDASLDPSADVDTDDDGVDG